MCLMENLDKVRLLAPDLRDGKDFPRSPRETLAGYVIAARVVDKCRADLAGWLGEYGTNCPLDRVWLDFAEIDYDELRGFLATGASDEQVEEWIRERAKQKTAEEIVPWNNQQRDRRLSDVPVELQVFMEGYVKQFVPRNKVVYTLFDIYDYEEQRA